jgi:hypothetical protein
MPNVMDAFEHLNSLDTTALFARRQALINLAPSGKYKDLPDEALQELVAIARVLRRKANGPARVAASRKPTIPTLDAL